MAHWYQSRERIELEKRRLRAYNVLIDPTFTLRNISAMFGVSIPTAYRWRWQILEEGKDGLLQSYTPGRPLKLEEEQRRELRALIREGKLKDYQSTARYIEKHFHVDYHRVHIFRLLKNWREDRAVSIL